MLDLAILGLLKEQDLHGYELNKRLSELFGAAGGVSYGSLYPALARLERSASVRTVTEGASLDLPEKRIPATGSLSGELSSWRARSVLTVTPGRKRKSRKIYRLTASGETVFLQLLADFTPGEDRRQFNLRVTLARHLDPEARLELFESRRRDFRERLRSTTSGSRGSDPWARSVLDHELATTAADLDWVETLISAEHSRPAHTSTHPRVSGAEAPTLSRFRPIGTASPGRSVQSSQEEPIQ